MAAPPIGLAVFGAGRIGAVHVRSVARLHPEATLVGVADLDHNAARRLVDEGVRLALRENLIEKEREDD